MGRQRAAELSLTNRRVDSREAERIGLVARTVPDTDLQEETIRLAKEISLGPPLAVATTKSTLWASIEAPSLLAAMDYELRGRVLAHHTEDAEERRQSVASKRLPSYKYR